VQYPLGWQEYSIVNADSRHIQRINAPGDMPLPEVMALLGTTGLTAYFGLFDVGRPKPGDTVVVSGAAGATGIIVCQLALLCSCRVIAIAGGSVKCDFLERQVGVHHAVDYKSKDFAKTIRQLTKREFVDVYFDNVGGEILDLMITRMQVGGRIVCCGAISVYNSQDKSGALTKYPGIISNRIIMQGFILGDYVARNKEAEARLAKWWSEGKVKAWTEIVEGGIEAAPSALNLLWKKGERGVGKLMVKVADPSVMAKM